jgi:hypothetical protein
MNHRAVAWSVLALSTCLFTASEAHAADLPLCTELAATSNAQPVYVAGSTAAEPLIRRVSAQLLAKKQYMVFYQPTATCAATKLITADRDKTSCADDRCLTGTALNAYFENGVEGDDYIRTQSCRLDPSGTHLDIAVSDLHYETCMNAALPSVLAWHRGPAVAMTFAVPQSQARKYISDDEAYSVFGLSCAGGVTPWTNSYSHFVPAAGSGVTELISMAIGVPSNQMWGHEPTSADAISGEVAVREALRNAGNRKAKAIGLLPASVLGETPAGELKALAFRARGQRYAFAPDVDRFARDKRNVRTGRYVPFAYMHLFLRRSDSSMGGPARYFYELFTGTATLSSFDIREAMINSSYIPACAMEVERTSEKVDSRGYFQDLKTYKPSTTKCGCFFEFTASGGVPPASSACLQCETDNFCAVRDMKSKCVDHFCTTE